MKLLTKLVNLNVDEYLTKRKMRKQMMKVLKRGYDVEFKKLSKEKVFGMKWDERLLSVYILDIAIGDFTEFHRMVKPIARNMDAKLFEWSDILSKDGTLLSYVRKVSR